MKIFAWGAGVAALALIGSAQAAPLPAQIGVAGPQDGVMQVRDHGSMRGMSHGGSMRGMSHGGSMRGMRHGGGMRGMRHGGGMRGMRHGGGMRGMNHGSM